MKLFCVIGEESGDIHASAVLSRLKQKLPNLSIIGTGGEYFRKISDKTYYYAEDLSVIGFWEVVKKRKFFAAVLERVAQIIKEEKPDILFLTDYPGFNLRLLKLIDASQIKVIYYISPQVWSWKKKRAFFLKKHVDLMITLFPFETKFLKDYADFDSFCFGHPILDDYEQISKTHSPYPANKDQVNIVALPGSRVNEVSVFLPRLIEGMKMARKESPNLNFYLIKADQISDQLLYDLGFREDENIKIIREEKKRWVHHADMAWCSSGTASMECAALKTPPIIFYQVMPITAFVGKWIFKIKTIGMPNILLQKPVFFELLQDQFTAQNLVIKTKELLASPLINKKDPIYDEIHKRLGAPGSYDKTADFIYDSLANLSKDNNK